MQSGTSCSRRAPNRPLPAPTPANVQARTLRSTRIAERRFSALSAASIVASGKTMPEPGKSFASVPDLFRPSPMSKRPSSRTSVKRRYELMCVTARKSDGVHARYVRSMAVPSYAFTLAWSAARSFSWAWLNTSALLYCPAIFCATTSGPNLVRPAIMNRGRTTSSSPSVSSRAKPPKTNWDLFVPAQLSICTNASRTKGSTLVAARTQAISAALGAREAFESSLAPAQASVACCSIASSCARTRRAPYAASA
mmetsp:Transcript_21452/g.50021  ORF Transcript_21452/g.50021 Transcript_21452/m.50021 type:complete len:253 (-) Transcript_21452:59-817(-)